TSGCRRGACREGRHRQRTHRGRGCQDVDPSPMTIENVDDHVRTYTDVENEQLAVQLLSITTDCHAGKLWPVSIDGLRAMHRRLFDGVRDHGGRFRAPAFGDEYLTFGPNRSVHRDRVLDEVKEVFRLLDRSVQSFVANRGDNNYERSAIHVA